MFFFVSFLFEHFEERLRVDDVIRLDVRDEILLPRSKLVLLSENPNGFALMVVL